MRKIYGIGPITALLGLFAIAANTAPAFAEGVAAGFSPWPQVTTFGGQDTFALTPCGGDSGMLGNVEAAQGAQANPMNAPVCN
jgi:hypothetical protein